MHIPKGNTLESIDLLTISQYLSDIVLCLNPNKQIIEFNKAAEVAFDCLRFDILGMDFIDFCKKVNMNFSFFLEDVENPTSQVSTFTSQLARSNGLQCIAWKILTNLQNENKFIFIGKDISLETNISEQLKLVAESLPGNYWWKDINGVYLGCNNAVLKFFGLDSYSEVIGKTDYDMPWFEYAKDLIKNDIEVMKAGMTQIKEEQLINKNGELFLFVVAKAPLRNAQGEIIGTIGTSIDVTEHKKGIRTIEKRLESVIDSIAGNHWWKDVNGVYLGCNDTFLETLSLNSPEEVIGKTDYELPWAETADYLVQNDQIVMQLGISQRREEQVTSKSGQTMTFMVMKAPLRDEEGNIIGTVGNSIDITEQKRIEKALIEAKEKAEEANLAKSYFLATISHELRTPLNGILGMADILTREKLTNHQRACIKDIETSGKNLLALVNEILGFSKLEAGKLELKLKSFNIQKVLTEIIANMRQQLKSRKIKISLHVAQDVPNEIIGDQLRLMQILFNLISNAIKFTEKGFISVEVLMASTTCTAVTLLFNVKDTGIGIPEDKLEQIFERFTQVESEQYNRRFGGVGLGLAIAKQLVEGMKGTIGVESKINKGSRFYFTIPFALPQTNLVLSQKDLESEIITPLNFNYYVLLIEDELINQRVASTMLAEIGCKFDIAKNGEEALQLFCQYQYDIILMDIRLPDTDGIKLTQKFRQIAKNHQNLPIIAMTAHALEEEIKIFCEAGMNDVITKPISQKEIIRVFQKITRS